MPTKSMVRTERVAPGIATPSFRHCRFAPGMAVTTVLKTARAPSAAAWGAGCVENTGRLLTIKMAFWLMAVPEALVARTEYVAASPVVTLANARVALVAPAIQIPFFRHWKLGAGLPVAAAVN